ncbi:MAG: phage portal protein [Thermomicrobiales bacterium]
MSVHKASVHQSAVGQRLSEEDVRRYRRYAELATFYDGAQWPARRQPGEVRLTFNYARALVRKVAAYVFAAPVGFSVPGRGDDARGNLAEALLRETVRHSALARLDADLCIEASVLGDAAIKVTWDAAAGAPVVAAVDPATLSAATLPDRPRHVVQMIQRYAMQGAPLRELAGTAIDAERMAEVVEIWTAEQWRVVVDGQVLRDEPNPYGWIPYVVVSSNTRPQSFWGESDLTDLLDICQELNARMSVLARVLQLSGAPIAVLENVDSSEGITVGPGARWELPKDSRAYLLDLLGSGGVSLHVDYINLLYRALHDLSETPRTAFGDSGRTISGAALEVEVQPLIQKVARKRQEWDAFYQQRNARLLDLLERFGGHELGGLRQTETLWPPVLPSDRDAAVRNAVALVESGIQSRHSAIAALGGSDPDAELERIRQEPIELTSTQ